MSRDDDKRDPKADVARFVAQHGVDGEEVGEALSSQSGSSTGMQEFDMASIVTNSTREVGAGANPPTDDDFNRVKSSVEQSAELSEMSDEDAVIERVSMSSDDQDSNFTSFLEETDIDELTHSEFDEDAMTLHAEDGEDFEQYQSRRGDASSSLKNINWSRNAPIIGFMLVMAVFVLPLFIPGGGDTTNNRSATTPVTQPERSFRDHEAKRVVNTAPVASEDELMDELKQLTQAIAQEPALDQSELIATQVAKDMRTQQEQREQVDAIDEHRIQRANEDAERAKRELEEALAREQKALAAADRLAARVNELKNQTENEAVAHQAMSTTITPGIPSKVNTGGYVLFREALASETTDRRWDQRVAQYRAAKEAKTYTTNTASSDIVPTNELRGLRLQSIEGRYAQVQLPNCQTIEVTRGMSLPQFGRVLQITERALVGVSGETLILSNDRASKNNQGFCMEAMERQKQIASPAQTQPILALPNTGQ